MATYLITGCSRGLGLAMAKQLASAPPSQVAKIFATSRSDSAELQSLVSSSSGRVVQVKLDAASVDSARAAASTVQSQLGGKGIDVLINNAGIMNYTPDGIQTMNDLDTTFNTNVTSAHIVTSAFLDLLRQGSRKVVANISTTLGSFGMVKRFSIFPVPAYKVSKAALNMLTVQYAQSFAEEGFSFIAISPGWLQTDLGSAQADLPVEKGSAGVLDIVNKADKAVNGQFFNIKVAGWENNPGLNQYDGANPPW